MIKPHEISAVSFRLMAVEAVLVDFLANLHMAAADPLERSKQYRERFRNVFIQTAVKNETGRPGSSVPGLDEYVTGELAHSVDRLLVKVHDTVARRVKTKLRGQK